MFSPSVYAGFIVWTLFCSNPLQLALAYFFDDKPKLEWRTAAIALGATTAVSVVGAICTLASTPRMAMSATRGSGHDQFSVLRKSDARVADIVPARSDRVRAFTKNLPK